MGSVEYSRYQHYRQPFECPDHFYVIDAQDFGWNRPQVNTHSALRDKDADVFYLARV